MFINRFILLEIYETFPNKIRKGIISKILLQEISILILIIHFGESDRVYDVQVIKNRETQNEVRKVKEQNDTK